MRDADPVTHESTSERVIKQPVFRGVDHALFALLSAAGLATIAAFFGTWFSVGWGGQPVLFILLVGVLAVVLVNQQGRWFLLLPMRRPAPMPPGVGHRVAVVTTYVPAAESAEMLEASIRALVAIDYPHDTWLLDEGDDPEIKALCFRLGARHFTRRNTPTYQTDSGPFRSRSKHGNYNAWLHEIGFAAYEYLVAVDPDHLPMPDYIEHTIGYFRDPRIGYVQAAVAFYNQAASVVARGAAEETYAYFSALQMAGYGLDYPIIVGSHNSHRMAALQALGGFAAHDADDLLLTLRYRAAGWQGVYVPRILARGLVPVDWRGYLVQQRRWARSVLDFKLRHRGPYAAALPTRTRIMSFLHGLNFLHRSVAFFVLTCVLAWQLAASGTLRMFSDRLILPGALLLIAVHLQELYRQRFYLDWRTEHGLHWRAALMEFAKWPWFLLATLDVITARRIHYAITWKTPRPGVYWSFVAWNVGLATVLIAAWGVGQLRGGSHPVLALVAIPVVVVSLSLAASALHAPPPPFTPGMWSPSPRPAQRPLGRPIHAKEAAEAAK